MPDGYCYGEHNDKNWRHSEYKVLQFDGDYQWRKITAGYQL